MTLQIPSLILYERQGRPQHRVVIAMKTPHVISSLFFPCIAFISILQSQVATTSLRGSVSDLSGAVISGAVIVLENKA
jgi:hypothetical protein